MQPKTKAVIVPKRSIGNFTLQCTISEKATDTLEVTEHPTAEGFNVADHAFLRPAQLNVEMVYDANPDKTLREIYSDLLKFQASREKFKVVTGKRSYTNMLIISLTQTTDASSENVLAISMQMRQIITVAVETTSVPGRPAKKVSSGVKHTGEKRAEKSEALSATPETDAFMKGFKQAKQAIFG